MRECENAEHDWIGFIDKWDRNILWCNTCKIPIKQFTGEEEVKEMKKIANGFK